MARGYIAGIRGFGEGLTDEQKATLSFFRYDPQSDMLVADKNIRTPAILAEPTNQGEAHAQHTRTSQEDQ